MTDTNEKYRVTAVALNVRAAPSISAKILGHVKKGALIEKTGVSADGKWIRHTFNNMEGWSSAQYLVKVVTTVPVPAEGFLWMKIADMEFGVVEVPGAEHNPRVLEYLSTVTNISDYWRSKDETPWCSAFVNWCMQQAGREGTNSAVSTSWLDWGQPIENPVKGCIAVFSREGGGGHVGFYFDEIPTLSENYIRILGGNQEHMTAGIDGVSLKYYPKSRLLGYRIPS